MGKKRLAIFASGNGSNTIKIIDHFEGHDEIEVSLIVCNRKNARVLKRTAGKGIKQILITNEEANNGVLLINLMKDNQIDFIVLSGYLRLIPEELINTYPSGIINIHPALLPKYGGPGMYGMHVHEAVKKAKEKESGITIHLVNAEYDKGKVIAQHRISLSEEDSTAQIQEKVQKLEHLFFAQEIENYILNPNG